MKQARQRWTNLLNPQLSYDNVMHAAVDIVPRVNFVESGDGENNVDICLRYIQGSLSFNQALNVTDPPLPPNNWFHVESQNSRTCTMVLQIQQYQAVAGGWGSVLKLSNTSPIVLSASRAANAGFGARKCPQRARNRPLKSWWKSPQPSRPPPCRDRPFLSQLDWLLQMVGVWWLFQ